MSEPKDTPEEIFKWTKDAIEALWDKAGEGDTDAADYLFGIAVAATGATAQLLGAKLPHRLVSRSEPLREAPEPIRGYLKTLIDTHRICPVIATLDKRHAHKGGIATPDTLEEFLIGAGMKPTGIEAASHKDRETAEFADIMHQALQWCCYLPDRREEAYKAANSHIRTLMDKVGELPPLLRNDLEAADWKTSVTGAAWREALKIYLPFYCGQKDWENHADLTCFDGTGKYPSDIRVNIINKILTRLHSMAE